MNGAPRISPDELKRLMDEGDDVVVVDVRRGSWLRSDVKIEGAIRADPDEPDEVVDRLAPAAKVVTYCT